MKILFISGIYPKEIKELLFRLSKGVLQTAPNTFQWAVVNGLFENQADFFVMSFPYLPCYPMRFKRLYSPEQDINIEGVVVGKTYRYCTLIGVKPLSIEHRLFRAIDMWIRQNAGNEQVYLLGYNPQSAEMAAMCRVKKKYDNVMICPIITDLVDDMMNFASNRKPLKRLQCIIEQKQIKKSYKYVDKFILLSKHMEEKIPEAIERNIVIEGIYGGCASACDTIEKKKAILYTGTLEEFAGVKLLVDAFLNVNRKDCELWICGGGTCSEYIKEKAEVDSRIKFFGYVQRNDALEMQKKAKFLINPRQPNGGITKYSFPSKTMEYLASGTPMIGYQLEGIPSEYYQYYYTPEDLSVESLTSVIEDAFDKPEAELQKMASCAQEFILQKKNSKAQVAKILDFLTR